jgi:glycyl-tRNA synthetase alpha chain
MNKKLNFQQLILELLRFWDGRGCVVQQPYDLEVGAGTMHPDTFLRVLGPEPWKVAYIEPSRRPKDGRYGENPYRVEKHHQLQVILKPSPDDVQDVYLESLEFIGIDPKKHDIRFEEDNWESPTLGAQGVGWQVTLDGMEITQFTYFQQAGGIELAPISVELTYGLERIAMFITNTSNMFDLEWCGSVTYGEMRKTEEREFSRYHFELADVDMHFRLFDLYEGEALKLLEEGAVLPAYDCCLKCSHIFNILDARGAISVTERQTYIARVRKLACRTAKAYLEMREAMGFPLLARAGNREDAKDKA